MKKFKYIQIPENVLFLHCKKTNNFFMSTVNKIFKTNVFPILLTKRYIAKIIAGLISMKSNNGNFRISWLNFGKTPEIIDFFS